VSLPDTASTPAAARGNYALAGNAAAQDLFNQRTVEQDAPLVAPHLRPGMCLVDFGCGAGSLTCGFARLIAPGEALGFDMSEDAIARARGLAQQTDLTNVRFSVADISQLDLPPENLDVAHFSNVLRYLPEPERALHLAFRSLKSGAIVAASEGYGAANWYAGPNAESMTLSNRVIQDAHKAHGGDPNIGRRLPALLRQAGFKRIESRPGTSAALSNTKALGAMMRAGWEDNLRPMLMRHGISAERCDQLFEEISIWTESEDSVASIAQCRVIGWKP
jgi:SAM-dependent methyltransferase